MRDRPESFAVDFLEADPVLWAHRNWRFTVDYEDDLVFLRRLYNKSGRKLPNMNSWQILDLVESNGILSRMAAGAA